MKVALIVLDAFSSRAVGPDSTPMLWSLAHEGGWNPEGGIGELTAATYPNHATFVTGLSTIEHGIVTNRVRVDGRWVSSAETGPVGVGDTQPVNTLFDACNVAGLRSVAAVGDHNLIGVCAAHRSDSCWPPTPSIPVGTRRNIGGYIADDEVVGAASRLDVESADFVFVQLDSVDGARHHFGAESAEALAQARLTDASLASLLELLRPCWDDTVVMVVSDHDQEDIGRSAPIDLTAHLDDLTEDGHEVQVENQGTAALVVGEVRQSRLLAIPGIEGVRSLDRRHHVVWGQPGQSFGAEASKLAADHGSPRTTGQLALVAGGHPAVRPLSKLVCSTRPVATAWPRWVAELLGVDLPAPTLAPA